jgi:hypothetical protein
MLRRAAGPVKRLPAGKTAERFLALLAAARLWLRLVHTA